MFRSKLQQIQFAINESLGSNSLSSFPTSVRQCRLFHGNLCYVLSAAVWWWGLSERQLVRRRRRPIPGSPGRNLPIYGESPFTAKTQEKTQNFKTTRHNKSVDLYRFTVPKTHVSISCLDIFFLFIQYFQFIQKLFHRYLMSVKLIFQSGINPNNMA